VFQPALGIAMEDREWLFESTAVVEKLPCAFGAVIAGLADQGTEGVAIVDTHITELPSAALIVGMVRGWENSAAVVCVVGILATDSTRYSLLIPLMVISSEAWRTGIVVGLVVCEVQGDEFIEIADVDAVDNGAGDALPYGC
jgi:hypothetical protein